MRLGNRDMNSGTEGRSRCQKACQATRFSDWDVSIRSGGRLIGGARRQQSAVCLCRSGIISLPPRGVGQGLWDRKSCLQLQVSVRMRSVVGRRGMRDVRVVGVVWLSGPPVGTATFIPSIWWTDPLNDGRRAHTNAAPHHAQEYQCRHPRRPTTSLYSRPSGLRVHFYPVFRSHDQSTFCTNR